MVTNSDQDNFPMVSVIIACYNAEKYIHECLDTILNQTYKNIEVIICDDSSTDNSYKVLQEYARSDKRIILLKNEKNLYAAATRNKCIQNSSGKYIIIQDIDDKSELARIEILLKHIKNESIDFVSSSMIRFNEFNSFKTLGEKQKPEYPNKYHFLWGLPFYHAPTIFKRECIITVNGYRVAKETRRGQDYDLFMRLYAKGYKGKNIRDKLYWYRVDHATIKRRSFDARIDECKLRYLGFKKMGLLPLGLPFIIKPFIAYLAQLIKYKMYYKK